MKIKLLFGLIIFLAFFLRFWDLGKNPPGINLDEAAIGYNAYSILKTGRDEYGQFLPLQFRSLDDYKPPLYIYLTIPTVAIFGLNEFSVRLPSALLGVGAVVLVYFLTKELLKDSGSGRSEVIGLVASGLLAISPWHLQFTRTAYETGSLAFFTTGGLLFFLYGIKKRPYLILSAVFFGLELYLYQAAKVFVPLFVIVLTLVNLRKSLIVFWLVFTLFLLPQVYLSITPQGQLRARGTSIFQDVIPHVVNLRYKTEDWLRNDNKSATIFHPESFAYLPTAINNYFLHLSPQFFFGFNLGPKVNYADNIGLMYLWEAPLLLAGLYFLIKSKKNALLLGSWILLAPVAASITINLPSAVRTAVFLPALQIVTALGAFEIFKKYKKIMYAFCLLAFAFLIYYLHMYYVHAPISQAKNWYQGYKEIILDSAKLAPNYNRVLVSNKLDQSLNFYQFYLNYDPKKYLQVDGGRVSGGFTENDNHLGNMYFRRDLNFEKERKTPGTLFVGIKEEFSSGAKIIREYKFLNGEVAAIIAE
ncbi:hypothetical protein A2872_02865 [Candidatus Gottesmanbacteria bacterium RIFCSPHIGHO2_01_FULL_42_12]|uniref:Glycosyltransferase RgtA/B/C/D-like domain-containing protein n=1 Tax=Candidatus Gottesmanbacteria bacterium RIFCSPHIGHO2_01_FULL_42_12 TaxID=1798377 RepID=A0A1F5Z3T6_9BACT|nr:MAG: hypothetical protein A2872_02865 [Candidatus Gottesmanbacteria bacterium RIFCSPHIGHO2_01_FULL_42_12]